MYRGVQAEPSFCPMKNSAFTPTSQPQPQDPGSLLREERGEDRNREGPLCFGHRIGAVTQVLTRAWPLDVMKSDSSHINRPGPTPDTPRRIPSLGPGPSDPENLAHPRVLPVCGMGSKPPPLRPSSPAPLPPLLLPSASHLLVCRQGRMWHLVKVDKAAMGNTCGPVCACTGLGGALGGAQPSLPHPAPHSPRRFLHTGGLAICRGSRLVSHLPNSEPKQRNRPPGGGRSQWTPIPGNRLHSALQMGPTSAPHPFSRVTWLRNQV